MRSPFAVVLLHFFGGSRREWALVVPGLERDRRVLAFDLPGFGDATAMGPADVAAMAAFVDARIVEAGAPPCVVVGHSMSAKVAAVLAAQAPGYLRGLVLVTASPPSPEPMTPEARRKLLAFDGSRRAAVRYVDGVTSKRLPDDLREIAIDDARRASSRAWKHWIVAGSREDWSARVGVLALPTLVIAASRDPSLGKAVQRRLVMPHFGHATLTVVDGGHALPLENPVVLQRRIARFIDGLRPAPRIDTHRNHRPEDRRMKLELTGKIALVSGADSGIGLETARQLLDEGVRVVITDQTDAALRKAVADLASHGEVLGIRADVTKLRDVQALWKKVRARLGEPDILVNAAGVTGATGDFVDVDDAGWQSTLDVILFGAVRMCREAIPSMRKKGWGRIVLIGSEDGVQPYPVELPYCAAKAGIINLAKGLSKAYGPDNVLVNSVSPAFIDTPMTDTMMKKRAKQKGMSFDKAISTFLDEERPNMALKRRGKAEEVAATIVFLCSERASFINGANFRVDSGSVATT